MTNCNFNTRRRGILIAGAGMAGKAIRLVVPFPAGGSVGADAAARSVPDGTRVEVDPAMRTLTIIE
jgi:tripartite-type tricarboxylate transporter receptor subunit TctC